MGRLIIENNTNGAKGTKNNNNKETLCKHNYH